MKIANKPLLTLISAPPVRYFAGEAAVAPATEGAPGEGGAAGGGGDPNADIMSFSAPDIEGVGDFLSGKGDSDPAVVPPTPAAPKKEPAAEPKPAAPATEPKPGAEPPAKQLRAELEAVKAERAELLAKLEKGDPRIADAEKAVKAKEAEIAEARTKLTQYERQLAMADPAVTEKLRAMDSDYDRTAGKFYSSVAELDNSTVKQLVVDLSNLPRNSPEYKAARLEWEGKVNEALGGSSEQEHRKLQKALDFIEQTYEFAMERPKVVKELEGSAVQLRQAAQIKAYGAQSETVRAGIERARAIPEGIDKTDPYHPRVMLAAFEKVLPPEQVESLNKGIPELIELALAGPKPRSDADYIGMTPEQVKESQAHEAAAHEAARGNAVDVMYNGLRALRVLPILMKEYQRLTAKTKEQTAALPPDPTSGASGEGRAGTDDIREYSAPDLAKMSFA